MLRKFTLGVAITLVLISPSLSRDLGQWENTDPDVKAWFESLKQPDHPTTSCCGEADAYWCDEVHVRKDMTFCTITDDRDDAPLMRTHIPVGTEIMIPDHKLGSYPGNPTGHAIAFISAAVFSGPDGERDVSKDNYYVYCFIQGGGI